jgi:hypothetical protein
MMCGPALWGLGRLRDVYPIYIYTRVGRDTDRAVKYTVESVACSNTTVAEPRAGILSRLALQYRRRRSIDARDDAHGDMFKAPGLTGT